MIFRIGECYNCGDCCLLFDSGSYKRCVHYDELAEKHCTIYATRPRWCREFPRSPMDIVGKPHCGFRFVDERGRTVDAFQDKRVKMKLIVTKRK
jgi:Fe-S-cluster containining protein